MKNILYYIKIYRQYFYFCLYVKSKSTPTLLLTALTFIRGHRGHRSDSDLTVSHTFRPRPCLITHTSLAYSKCVNQQITHFSCVYTRHKHGRKIRFNRRLTSGRGKVRRAWVTIATAASWTDQNKHCLYEPLDDIRHERVVFQRVRHWLRKKSQTGYYNELKPQKLHLKLNLT